MPKLRFTAVVLLGAVLALSASAATPSSGSGVVAARVTASPLWLTLRLDTNEAAAGRRIRTVATLQNVGRATLRSASLELRRDPSGLMIIGPERRSISNLKPGKTRTVHWHVCGTVPANYVIVAVALARTNAGTVYETESEAELLTIRTRERGPSCGDDDD